MAREGLEMTKKMYGPDHLGVAISLYNIASLAQLQGRLREAESLGREALTMSRKLGSDGLFLAPALNGLGDTLRDEGKLEEARQMISEGLELRRKLLGSEDPKVADSLANLANVLERQGRLADAEPLARECLAIREGKIPDDWRAFDARSLLGENLAAQQKYNEAEPLLISGYEGMKLREDKIPADRKIRLREVLEHLVLLYKANGRSDQALEWQQRLDEFDKSQASKESTEATNQHKQ